MATPRSSGPIAKTWPILVAFFFSGLINNFVYVVFLSAAVDILESNASLSKGVVLLADILPSLVVKLVAPYFIHHIRYGTRVVVCSVASFSALHLVASFQALPLRLLGVVLASAASGLGELSFLMLTSYFDPVAVSAWSSGTGGAGVTGSLMFLALTAWFNLSTSTTLRTVSLLPPTMMVFFYLILWSPLRSRGPLGNLEAFAEPGLAEYRSSMSTDTYSAPLDPTIGDPHRYSHLPKVPVHDMTLNQRLQVVRSLLSIYILPLLVVYWAEYTINQGINPTILFPLSTAWHYPFKRLKDHYVYYQAIYQMGVFVSRSSVHWFPIRQVWYPSGAQVGILAVMLSQSLFGWIPSVWLVFGIIFVEGLLGGATYVNTFFNITHNVPANYREFALGVVGVGDSIGITLAGLTALWLEPSLCRWQQHHDNDLCIQL
ncbi:protein BTN1 [Dimargaris cristalligena]|uniref:Protein BTN n=1 Tax=Dimargaris cristalligena TaxID=215637 RepID=A0A4P9ZQU5_9FUNG|nr:protein BTN1 [Dimargaris cristalligena]|eukprot:RKP35866.1 protein BTN1 [Dimargaris cristalligena]